MTYHVKVVVNEIFFDEIDHLQKYCTSIKDIMKLKWVLKQDKMNVYLAFIEMKTNSSFENKNYK